MSVRYSESIQTGESKQGLYKTYSNRSLAYSRAQRYVDALHDAQKTIELAPSWSKGYWRLGMAFLGLKQTTQAIEAFAKCWHLDHGSPDTERQLLAAIEKATVAQLGAGITALLVQAEQQHVIEPARLEGVGEAEQQEAWFRHLTREQEGPTQVDVYRRRYAQWLKQAMTAHTAYIQRACISLQAKCYLQARWDARQAVIKLASQLKECMRGVPEVSIDRANKVEQELCEAYWRLGQAFAAERDHPDQDHRQAAKALSRAMDLAPHHNQILQEVQEAKTHLTLQQLAEAYVSRLAGLLQLSNGHEDSAAGKQVEGLVIESVRLAAAKSLLDPLGMQQVFQARIRECRILTQRSQPAADMWPRILSAPETVVRDDVLLAAVGMPGRPSLPAALINLNPAPPHTLIDEPRKSERAQATAMAPSAQLVEIPRPKLEMVVPYKQYKLVRGDGSAPERTKKHPFCMSRVHYSAADRGEEVWAEVGDGSCRWRQTASEVTLLCLGVPPHTPAKQLQVNLDPYFIKVVNKVSGGVYLEGHLEQGIVPEESVWEHGGGVGENGCLLYLHKMNLQLLRKEWQHSETWWPRLFQHHQPIQWDDYDKDYSDLPLQIMRKHACQEALQDAERQIENEEKQERARLQDQDDRRKQTRQARLKVLRACGSGSFDRMQPTWQHAAACTSLYN
ncbi:MAG: heat shock STI-like [Trebouxia sp. A1-2]|nr:MAG: heat shock STI-like [Trebouxia sp. A1-2]